MAQKLAIQNAEINSSAFKMSSYKRLESAWKLVADLWGSPLEIREHGTEYLTQFRKEPNEKYQERLKKSVFTNDFRHAIESMAGMVFRTDPRPIEVHDEIEAMLTDIDLCGNSFWNFNVDNFQLFVRDGNGYIYVDAPPLSSDVKQKIEAGEKPTLRDRLNDRPYLVFYRASQILSLRYKREGSRDVLTQAVIEEMITEPDGDFGEKQIIQHRILRPGSYEVRQKNEKDEFVPVAGGTTGMKEIPLIPVVRDLTNPPPLLTLAMLDVLYYNQTSDYDNICHMVCVPLRVDKYDTKEDATAAGKMQTNAPGVGMKIWGENAEISYVEISGSGMARARERYTDIKAEKATIGVGMMAPNDIVGIRTATEVADTAGQRQSKLANLTRLWENAMEKALYFMAEYVNAIKGAKTIDLENAEEATKMKLKIDYNRLTFSIDQLSFFSELVDSGKLSLQTFLEWLPQVADMPPGFEPATEMKRITSMNTIIVDSEPPREGEDS